MNYLAHALPFLERPYFAAATGVPDWLMVADRKVRLRRKHVDAFLADPARAADPTTVAVAEGVRQHLRDDAVFHGTRIFAETSLQLTVLARDALQRDQGFRPGFLGHLLTEVLLDAALAAERPQRLDAYYRMLASVEPVAIEDVVNRVAPRRTERLAPLIAGFCEQRILFDYLEDGKLMVRLNQVMRRVRLPELPEPFREILPPARQLVTDRRGALLAGTPCGG